MPRRLPTVPLSRVLVACSFVALLLAVWLLGGCDSQDPEIGCADNIACVWVDSYPTRDGGFVPGHWRSTPGRQCPCASDDQPRPRDG